jgi:hypothetical protein
MKYDETMKNDEVWKILENPSDFNTVVSVLSLHRLATGSRAHGEFP